MKALPISTATTKNATNIYAVNSITKIDMISFNKNQQNNIFLVKCLRAANELNEVHGSVRAVRTAIILTIGKK